jgi:hypothetical protein
MASYLTASLTARLVVTICGFIFGSLWIAPVQLLFGGMIVDLFVILTLALNSTSNELLHKNSTGGHTQSDSRKNEQVYLRRLITLSAAVGGALAVSQLIIVFLSMIWKVSTAGQSTLIFLSTLPSMAVLLWETGRQSDFGNQKFTISKMVFLAVAAVLGFLILCFVFPALGTPFGIGAISPSLIPLALIPPAVLLALCEGLHRLLGDL